MELLNLEKELSSNEYPGRGIIVGKSDDGKFAVTAYWIMGRSENSRNRIFLEDGDGIKTQAFDPAKLTDPSLIIYSPVRTFKNYTIVTNGDQTDTIYDGLSKGLSFAEALDSRRREPDGPNFTPRISALLKIEKSSFSYTMSILKSDNGQEDADAKYVFSYDNPKAGLGRYIHTYMQNANPLPSFEGEPALVDLTGDIDDITQKIWTSLNESNKVSLFVRFIDLQNGQAQSRIVNKNK